MRQLYSIPLASASVIPTHTHIRRLLSKFQTPAQLDQQQKHPVPFVDFLTNPTGESGEVI